MGWCGDVVWQWYGIVWYGVVCMVEIWLKCREKQQLRFKSWWIAFFVFFLAAFGHYRDQILVENPRVYYTCWRWEPCGYTSFLRNLIHLSHDQTIAKFENRRFHKTKRLQYKRVSSWGAFAVFVVKFVELLGRDYSHLFELAIVKVHRFIYWHLPSRQCFHCPMNIHFPPKTEFL